MFRDPGFYKSLREKVLPYLETYPHFKIWHAGCAYGEEVYSMAILLKEEGLYDRATLFATDFNESALETAKEGIFPIHKIKQYTANYQDAGCKESFADYYHAKYESAIMDKSLKERVTFANHNLVIDGVFSEMHLIICRNVLIYFDRELQSHVIGLFNNSLIPRGYLAFGTKESLQFSGYENDFDKIDSEFKIYRKKRR
jgi:chemotaxis protein methyltransferase CheR